MANWLISSLSFSQLNTIPPHETAREGTRNQLMQMTLGPLLSFRREQYMETGALNRELEEAATDGPLAVVASSSQLSVSSYFDTLQIVASPEPSHFSLY